MARMFLNRTEVKQLTGTCDVDKQIQWLEDNRWKHEVNFIERPVILRAYAEKKLGMTEPETPQWKPHIGAHQR